MNNSDVNDVPARMMLDENPKQPEIAFDKEMWFLSVLDNREQSAVKIAYEYAKMGQPGLPSHLYLIIVHKLSELLRQIPVELVEDGED